MNFFLVRCKFVVLFNLKTQPKSVGLAVHKTSQKACKLNVNGVGNSCQKPFNNTTASTPPKTRFLDVRNHSPKNDETTANNFNHALLH